MTTKFKRPFCPVCKVIESGKFCSTCGSDLVEGARSCPCGYSNIWPHETFCQECGCKANPLTEKGASNVRTAGTLINDLIAIAAKQARIDEIDREYAQLLHADIRKYRQCQACEGGGENPPQCGRQAVPGTEFCLQHTVE